MANTYTRLAASRPADTNEAELYASSEDEYIIATLHVCNQTASELSYRVAITDASGAASGEDWIYYDFPIHENMAHRFSLSFGNGDTLRIRSSSADSISFVLTGLKVS